ncbi:hypothetical protein [Paenibacillus monticola]|uniref:Uncharacterized protein n=1 Tax=Paenibacillus monticola TaxID=2666075 RepID=A0A7X2H3X2_9BACL|nr:hypothetical protein [Paenibacillus monticola]MRN53036.1 hypothetical protein [Paenibacillus monticola]
MKNGIYAIYKGNEYEAGTKGANTIVLRSYNCNDISKGFSLYKNILYTKNVERNEVEELYSISTIADFKGIKFQVIKEEGSTVLLSSINGDYKVLENLGLDMADKGVYQKWIDISELTSMHEEKNHI